MRPLLTLQPILVEVASPIVILESECHPFFPARQLPPESHRQKHNVFRLGFPLASFARVTSIVRWKLMSSSEMQVI